MLKFTPDHEWLQVTGDVATVGITAHAVEQLGDLVFLELPEVGKQLKRGESAATVESGKAASEIYAPLDGEVLAVNQAIAADPSIVNSAPTAEGWFFKLKLANSNEAASLLDEQEYNALVG